MALGKRMLRRDQWHDSITEERILEAAQADEDIGFCLACGDEAWGVEPDARNYKCSGCSEWQVFGAEELVIYIA